MMVSRGMHVIPCMGRSRRPWRWAGLAALLAAVVAVGVTGWARLTPTPSAGSPIIGTSSIGPYPEAMVVAGHAHRGFIMHQDGTITVLDTANGRVVRRVMVGPFGYSPSDAAVAEQAGRVFVASAGTDGQGTDVSVLDAHSGTVLRTVRVGADPHSVAVDERRGRVLVGTYTGIAILDAGTGGMVRSASLGSPVDAVAVNQRTGRVFVALASVGRVPMTGGAGSVRVLDGGSGATLSTTALGYQPGMVAVDEQANRLFVAGADDGTVSTLDMRTGRLLRNVVVHGVGLVTSALAVDAPSGRVVVVSTPGGGGPSASSQATLLDARTGLVIRTIPVAGAAWSLAVDNARGQAYIPTTPLIVLDIRTGTIRITRAPGGTLVALDAQAMRALVVSPTAVVDEANPWAWLPSWLPFLPPRGRRVVPASPGVNLVDTHLLQEG